MKTKTEAETECEQQPLYPASSENQKDMPSTQMKMRGEEEKKRDSSRKGLVDSLSGGYQRVPSHGTISANTTSTSLVKDFDTQCHNNFAPEFPLEEGDSFDEEEDFEKTKLHFQHSKKISIDSIGKSKMEMETRGGTKGDNIKNAVPFNKQLSADSIKVKDEYSINCDESPYRETTQKIRVFRQLLAALAVSLGSLVVGFTTAYTSPALATMKENSTITITDDQASWIGGLMPLAALVGGLIGGILIVRVGRRNTITAITVPFIVSWVVIASAPNVYVVYVGRTLGGLCVGIGSLAFPVYLGETLQPEVRGQFGLLPTALGNIGILICFVAGKYVDWSILAYLGAVLPLPCLVLMLLVPETPRWYVSKGNNRAAKNALQWLRHMDNDVDGELREIVNSHKEAEQNTRQASIADVFSGGNLLAVAILLGLMFFQQMSGINAVIFYTVFIFQSAGSTIDENLSTIIVGIVNFAATFVATFLIDRLGRKVLLYISATTMVITLGVLGTYFYMLNNEFDVSSYGWVPLASFVIYVIGFSLGFGPIPWLMMGEILPARIRGLAASIATAFNWLCTFIVTKTFNNMINTVGTHGTFWIFGFVCLAALFFTLLCVPETRGKSLEDIEKRLYGKK